MQMDHEVASPQTARSKQTARSTPAPRSRLGRVLLANGRFSFVSGAILLVGAFVVDTRMGVSGWVLATVGAGLVPYGLWLRSVASGMPVDRRSVWVAIAGDASWVVGAVVVLAVPGTMTGLGKWALGTVSAVVLAFAVAQSAEVRRAHRPDRSQQLPPRSQNSASEA